MPYVAQVHELFGHDAAPHALFAQDLYPHAAFAQLEYALHDCALCWVCGVTVIEHVPVNPAPLVIVYVLFAFNPVNVPVPLTIPDSASVPVTVAVTPAVVPVLLFATLHVGAVVSIDDTAIERFVTLPTASFTHT